MPSRQQTSLARQTASPSRPLPRVVGPVGAAGHRARGAPQRSGAGEGMGVARKQDAKEVVGTGRATRQQYQPRRLQVRHGRDTLQECVLGRALLSQEHLCERVAACAPILVWNCPPFWKIGFIPDLNWSAFLSSSLYGSFQFGILPLQS